MLYFFTLESFARCGFFVMAGQKLSKKRSLHIVNEHFETIFKASTPANAPYLHPCRQRRHGGKDASCKVL